MQPYGVAPNRAKPAAVLAHGLVEVGEQEDDEDGLEIVYELPVDGRPAPPA